MVCLLVLCSGRGRSGGTLVCVAGPAGLHESQDDTYWSAGVAAEVLLCLPSLLPRRRGRYSSRWFCIPFSPLCLDMVMAEEMLEMLMFFNLLLSLPLFLPPLRRFMMFLFCDSVSFICVLVFYAEGCSGVGAASILSVYPSASPPPRSLRLTLVSHTVQSFVPWCYSFFYTFSLAGGGAGDVVILNPPLPPSVPTALATVYDVFISPPDSLVILVSITIFRSPLYYLLCSSSVRLEYDMPHPSQFIKRTS